MIHEIRAFAAREGSRRAQNGIVLPVAVEGDDQRTARQVEAGGQRRGLAVVRAELDDAEQRQLAGEVAEARARRVRRTVVDDDHLVRLPQALHHALEAQEQRAHVVLLVVDGDDDGERRVGHAPLPPAVRSSPRVRLRALR